MTDPDRPIAEDELHAYVDGRLDSGRRMEVERYLRLRPEVARRVAIDISQRDALRAAFAAKAAEPIPPSLNLTHLVEARLARRRAPWRMAAAVAGALLFGGAVGGAAGWALGSRPPSGIAALAQEAAASYTVYAMDARRPVELAATDSATLSRWLSRRLNHKVAPPDISALGYHLLGGRLVATPRGPAALFVYENDRATRLALFMRPMATDRSMPIRQVDIGDLDGCVWIERNLGYTVVAAESYDRLLALSRHVRQQVQVNASSVPG